MAENLVHCGIASGLKKYAIFYYFKSLLYLFTNCQKYLYVLNIVYELFDETKFDFIYSCYRDFFY